MASVTPDVRTQTAARQRRFQRGYGTDWLFLLPAAVFFIGWQLYPLLRVLWLSFTNYRYLGNDPARWVGLANYQEALIDPLFHTGLLRAFAFTLMFLPGTIVLPLLLAVLIDRVATPWLASLYRIILLIPAVIPGPLIFVLWKWLYDFQVGPINQILVNVLHLYTAETAPQWIGGTALSLPAVAIMELWWGLGYHTMFFLAGLAAIPRDLPEAARIDGANEWNMFWHVTVPRLLPVLSVLVVLRFGSAMSVIDEFLIFGGFNRATPTYTWTVYMYDLAFHTGEWLQGYAAAIGWLGALVMMVVVVGLLYVFRSRDA